MAERNDDNDPGRPAVPAAGGPKAPWGSHRRSGAKPAGKGTTRAATGAATDEATNVRRIRAEEGEANQLGFRDDTVIDPETPIEERPRSHKRKPPPEPEPEPLRNIIPPDGAVAGLLLSLAEGMFAAAWGPEGRFTPKERAIIEPPLGRIIARMSPGDAAKFASFADPIFLASGLLIYGMRIWTVQQSRVPNRQGEPGPPDRSVPVVQGVPVSGPVPGQQHQPAEHKDVAANGTDKAAIAAEWGRL